MPGIAPRKKLPNTNIENQKKWFGVTDTAPAPSNPNIENQKKWFGATDVPKTPQSLEEKITQVQQFGQERENLRQRMIKEGDAAAAEKQRLRDQEQMLIEQGLIDPPPGMAETAGRSFMEGLAPDLLEELLAGREKGFVYPDAPVYSSLAEAAAAKRAAAREGKKFGYDFEKQEEYKEEVLAPVIEEETAIREAGEKENPVTAWVAETVGILTPYFPGGKIKKVQAGAQATETFLTKVFGSEITKQMVKGAIIEGARSEHEIGSEAWKMDTLFGALGAGSGPAIAAVWKTGKGWVLKAGGKYTDKVKEWLKVNAPNTYGRIAAEEAKTGVEKVGTQVNEAAIRWLSKERRVAGIAAMQAKYQYNAKLVMLIPGIGTLGGIVDDIVVTRATKLMGTRTRTGLIRKGAEFIGEKMINAHLSYGGTTTIFGGLLTAGVFGVADADIMAAFKGTLTAGAIQSIIQTMKLKGPEFIQKMGGKTSRWGKILAPLLEKGPDAFGAGLIALSNNENFQKFMIDMSGGAGTYDKIVGSKHHTNIENQKKWFGEPVAPSNPNIENQKKWFGEPKASSASGGRGR